MTDCVKESYTGISIHALLAESDPIRPPRSPPGWISIHALLAESDDWPPVREIIQWISIHALLAESDSILDYFSGVMRQFLSTLSLRRATLIACQNGQLHDFYPRSPCGERHRPVTMHTWKKVFLSTLSLRRATSGYFRFSRLDVISIHALLAESDQCGSADDMCQYQFLSTLSLRRATCV